MRRLSDHLILFVRLSGTRIPVVGYSRFEAILQDLNLVKLHRAAADPRLGNAFHEDLRCGFDLGLHSPVSLDRDLAGVPVVCAGQDGRRDEEDG